MKFEEQIQVKYLEELTWFWKINHINRFGLTTTRDWLIRVPRVRDQKWQFGILVYKQVIPKICTNFIDK